MRSDLVLTIGVIIGTVIWICLLETHAPAADIPIPKPRSMVSVNIEMQRVPKRHPNHAHPVMVIGRQPIPSDPAGNAVERPAGMP